jgi:hypothetical protein
MPRGKERQSIRARDLMQRIHFTEARSRRLFQHDVLTGFERLARQLIASLGRRAQ